MTVNYTFSRCLLSVQLCRKNIGSSRYDGQTAGTGDRVQDYGPGKGLDARQEEGTCTRESEQLSSILIIIIIIDFPFFNLTLCL